MHEHDRAERLSSGEHENQTAENGSTFFTTPEVQMKNGRPATLAAWPQTDVRSEEALPRLCTRKDITHSTKGK